MLYLGDTNAVGGKHGAAPSGPVVEALTKTLALNQRSTDRNNYVDRGADSVHRGYSKEEFGRVNKRLLEIVSANRFEAIRTRLNILLGHYLVLRDEQRREADLADLSLVMYPKEEGPTECPCLVLRIDKSKTNRKGKARVMGAIRNTDPLLCPFGALARYLFCLWG